MLGMVFGSRRGAEAWRPAAEAGRSLGVVAPIIVVPLPLRERIRSLGREVA